MVGEIKFKFYGKYNYGKNLTADFLILLNLVEFNEEVDQFVGLYAVEKRYGKEIFRKISELVNLESKAIILYKYLTSQEQSLVNQLAPDTIVYVLNHKMIDAQYFKSTIKSNTQMFKIILQQGAKGSLRSNLTFLTNEILYVKPIKKHSDIESDKKSIIALPILLISIFKFFVSPIVALKQYSFIIKLLNSRLVERTKECSAFFLFLIKFMASKLYGAIVDLYYFFERYIKVLYNILVRLYYLLIEFYYFFEIRIKKIYYAGLKFYYFVEISTKKKYYTYLLPYYYKIYDLCYRIIMWVIAFTKLVIFYPFRKAYWFLEFQYNKRIRKSIDHDRS